jgi:plastocyanin
MWKRGIVAAGASVAAAGAFAVAGVAGADQVATDHAVYARDANGPCFSTSATNTDCAANERGDISIATGDSVTWHVDGPTAHNAAAANDVPADPTWKDYTGNFVNNGGSDSRSFTQPGDYDYVCQAHDSMKGTIHVTGAPTGTPTPTPSSTATATPTPTPTTQPSGGGQTPPPGGIADTVKPTVRSIKLKAQHRAARVTFTLSENATVTIRVKSGSKLLKSVNVQARAGTRTVTVRSSKLKKGRYTIEVRARDAFGNNSALAKKPLRITG